MAFFQHFWVPPSVIQVYLLPCFCMLLQQVVIVGGALFYDYILFPNLESIHNLY